MISPLRSCISVTIALLAALGFSGSAQADSHGPAELARHYGVEAPAPAPMAFVAIDEIVHDVEGIFVLDRGSGRIYALDEQGAMLWMTAGLGDRAGQLSAPIGTSDGSVGLALDGDGWIHSWDQVRERIQVFDSNGTFLRAIEPPPQALEKRIVDIAIDEEGDILLAAGDAVTVLDPEGRHQLTWGERGNQDGTFASVAEIIPLGDGTVALLESRRIQRFTKDGRFLNLMSPQLAEGERAPLFLDAVLAEDGLLWASDQFNPRLRAFSLEGAQIQTLDMPVFGTGGGKALVLSQAPDGTWWVAGGPNSAPNSLHQAAADGLTERTIGTTAALGGHQLDGLVTDDDGGFWGYQSNRGLLRHIDARGKLVGTIDIDPDSEYLQTESDPGLARTPAGHLVVPYGDRVLRIHPDGERLVEIRMPEVSTGIRPRPLPKGVIVGEDGTIYVGEQSNPSHRVWAFAPDGRELWRTIGGSGTGPARFHSPSGLVMDAEGELLVLDWISGQVVRLDAATGNPLGLRQHGWDPLCQLPGPLFGNSLVAEPDGTMLIAFDSSDDPMIAERQIGRWDATGSLQSVVAAGVNPRHFIRDARGRLVVAASAPELVTVFGQAADAPWRSTWHADAWLSGWPLEATLHEDLSAIATSAPGSFGSLSVRGRRELVAGEHALTIRSAGGARVWVGDRLLLDAWEESSVDSELPFTILRPETVEVRIDLRTVDTSALEIAFETGMLLTPEPPPTATATTPPTVAPTVTPTLAARPADWPPLGPNAIYLPTLHNGSRTSPAEPSLDPWLPIESIDVLSYDIDLRVAEMGPAIPLQAVVTITLQAQETVEAVELDAEPSAIHVSALSVDGQERPWSFVPGKANPYGLTGSRLHVPLARPLPRGEQVELTVRYEIAASSLAHDRGFEWIEVEHESNEDKGYLATRNSPYFARYWLPSNDHPADPAHVSFTFRLPEGRIAAATGRPTNDSHVEPVGQDVDGLSVFRWRRSKPVQTYLLRVVLGDIDVLVKDICMRDGALIPPEDCQATDERQPVVMYSAQEFTSDAWPAWTHMGAPGDGDQEALARFTDLLGPYPNDTLGIMMGAHPYNMEYAGMIVFPTIRAPRVHELLHGWFGNTVWIRSWGDFWIKEGIVRYLDGYRKERPGEARTNLQGMCMPDTLARGADFDMLAEFDSPRQWVPYVKGEAAWHALRWNMAETAGLGIWEPTAIALFEGLVADLYRDFAYDFLTTEGLVDWLAPNIRKQWASQGIDLPLSEAEELVRAWESRWLR